MTTPANVAKGQNSTQTPPTSPSNASKLERVGRWLFYRKAPEDHALAGRKTSIFDVKEFHFGSQFYSSVPKVFRVAGRAIGTTITIGTMIGLLAIDLVNAILTVITLNRIRFFAPGSKLIMKATTTMKAHELGIKLLLFPQLLWFTFFKKRINGKLQDTRKLESDLAFTRLNAISIVTHNYPELKAIIKKRNTKEIRKELNRLIEEKGKDNTELQDLAAAFRIGSAGYDALKDFGATRAGKVKNDWASFGAELSRALEKSGTITHRDPIDSIIHRILSPKKSWCSITGEKSAEKYDSYSFGNQDISVFELDAGDHKTTFTHSATPGGKDKLFGAVCEKVKNSNAISFVHSLQHSAIVKGKKKKKYEHGRNQLMLDEIKDNKNVRALITPMDGEAWKSEGRFQPEKWHDAKNFAAQYHNYAMRGVRIHEEENNGFYYTEDTLTDGQFEKAFIRVGDAFENVKPGTYRDVHRVQRAMQLLTQAMLGVGGLLKAHKDSGNTDDEAFFIQACKQDIDRGVAANVVTKFLLMKLAGTEPTEDDIHLLIGTVIGRSEMVDRRSILEDRVRPLLDLFHLMKGGDLEEKITEQVKAYAKEDIGFKAKGMVLEDT